MIYTSYFAKLKELENTTSYQSQSVAKHMIGIKGYRIRSWLRSMDFSWNGRRIMIITIT